VFGLKSIVRVFIYRFDVPAGKADEIISEIVENYLVDELVIIGHELA